MPVVERPYGVWMGVLLHLVQSAGRDELRRARNGAKPQVLLLGRSNAENHGVGSIGVS